MAREILGKLQLFFFLSLTKNKEQTRVRKLEVWKRQNCWVRSPPVAAAFFFYYFKLEHIQRVWPRKGAARGIRSPWVGFREPGWDHVARFFLFVCNPIHTHSAQISVFRTPEHARHVFTICFVAFFFDHMCFVNIKFYKSFK